MPESRNAKSRASSYRKAFGSMTNYSTAGARGLGFGYRSTHSANQFQICIQNIRYEKMSSLCNVRYASHDATRPISLFQEFILSFRTRMT